MHVRGSLSSKRRSQDDNLWQRAVRNLDLNAVHNHRKCDISIIMENNTKAATYIRQLYDSNNNDDTLIIIDIQDVHTYFNEIMFRMPRYIDPTSTKLFLEVFSNISTLDLEKFLQNDNYVHMFMIKLRIFAALKEHIFNYEDPIRRKEALMEEYTLLMDVPHDVGRADSKKKGGKKQQKGSKSKSTKSTKSAKKGKKKAGDKDNVVIVEEPCLMLENNVKKQSRQPRWNSVNLKPRILQIILTNCYNFDYIQCFNSINVPIKCIVEVSLPSIIYPDILPRYATCLSGHASNLSIYSFNNESTTNSAVFVPSLSEEPTPLNYASQHQVDEFWKHFNRMINKQIVPNYIRNLLYLKYVPIDMPIEKNLPFYEDQCLVTYDEIKYLLQSTDTITRMYKNYEDNIKVFNTAVDSSKSDKAFCYKKYSATLDCLPPDVCTVPIILDALLNEVEVQLQNKNDEPTTENGAVDINDGYTKPRNRYYSVRNLLVTLLKEYRLYTHIDTLIPACNSINNILLNIKIDKNQIRLHENNKMADCFHSYLNLRVPLEKTFANILKRQPLCNALKKYIAIESIKNCNEVNNLSTVLHLDPEQVVIYLGMIIFNLINWSSYERRLDKEATIDCNEDLKKLIQIITGQKANRLNYCDSIMESASCQNINPKLDFVFYEKLSKIEMLQELNSNCNWYNSIKHYYCSLLDAILVEFGNDLNDFGLAYNNWTCILRTIPNSVTFSRNILFEEMRWLTIQEQKYQTGLDSKKDNSKTKESDVEVTNQSNQHDQTHGISFVLKNTLKDVLMNLDLPEINTKNNQLKLEKPVKMGKNKERHKSTTPSLYSTHSAKYSKFLDVPVENAPKEPAEIEKPFFADIGTHVDKMTGRTTTFVSRDGVKIIFNKNNDIRYDSLNIDINQDQLFMHITRDEYFKFHFHLKNDVIINFIKPVNKSVVDHVKTDKLYTVFRNYSYRLNNFYRLVKKQETYLLSDDVLERIRSNILRKSHVQNSITQIKTSATSLHKVAKNSPTDNVQSSPEELIGDNPMKELKTKQAALELLQQAKLSSQPVFKICSGKLHQFKYITRNKSHADINIKDAAVEIANKRNPPIKHKYLIRELVGSIDNDDINSTMPYNYTITFPTSLTVRSEIDIQGNKQIKQYYVQKGPQFRDIHTEVSRTFTYHGDMIIKRLNGTITILSLNGDIISFEVPLFDRSNSCKPKKKPKTQDKYLRAMRRLIKCYHKHSHNRFCLNSSRKQLKYHLYQYISPNSLLITKRFKFPYPKYSILRIDGKKISFKQGKYVQKRDFFPKLEEDVVYATFKYIRKDGTSTELKRNGDMITTFPDQTLLISSYQIDEELVYVEIDYKSASDDKISVETECVMSSAWVLIHSTREFRHPYYATVKMGGVSNMTDIALPCDMSLLNIGDEFKLKINPNVQATFDTSQIVVSSNFCSFCEGGTNTTINIKKLYENKTLTKLDDFLLFRDSFKRFLEIRSNGTIAYNDDIEDGLNMYQCTAHRVFNTKKFYILKHNLSGIRLWTNNTYTNRLMEACQNLKTAPHVTVRPTDDIYFLVKKYVLLHNKYLMEPINPESFYETYRFLQIMPYNKHTTFLLQESDAVTTTTKSRSARTPILTEQQKISHPPSEIKLASSSSVTLFKADGSDFESIPELSPEDISKDRYERMNRICQKRREREFAAREKIKQPINYFLYKEMQELEEHKRKQAMEECHTKSNLKVTHKAIKLIPDKSGDINKSDNEKAGETSRSIHTLYSSAANKYFSEVFNVKSYSSVKRYSSINEFYARTCSSTDLIKQYSALDLVKLSALIKVYHPNQSSHFVLKK